MRPPQKARPEYLERTLLERKRVAVSGMDGDVGLRHFLEKE
jgi:hypothetical protein